MKRIFALLAAILCLCSCEKEHKHWLSHTWYGENETMFIAINFSADRSTCALQKGVPGDDNPGTFDTFYVDAYDDDRSFTLREYPGDSEIIYTSEVVDGRRLIKWRSGDEEMSLFIHALLLE